MEFRSLLRTHEQLPGTLSPVLADTSQASVWRDGQADVLWSTACSGLLVAQPTDSSAVATTMTLTIMEPLFLDAGPNDPGTA
jgi:hypothetical protein